MSKQGLHIKTNTEKFTEVAAVKTEGGAAERRAQPCACRYIQYSALYTKYPQPCHGLQLYKQVTLLVGAHHRLIEEWKTSRFQSLLPTDDDLCRLYASMRAPKLCMHGTFTWHKNHRHVIYVLPRPPAPGPLAASHSATHGGCRRDGVKLFPAQLGVARCSGVLRSQGCVHHRRHGVHGQVPRGEAPAQCPRARTTVHLSATEAGQAREGPH